VNTFHSFTVLQATAGTTMVATFKAKYSYKLFEVDLSNPDVKFELIVDGQKFLMEEFNYKTYYDTFFENSVPGTAPPNIHETVTFPVIPEGAVASVFADEYETVNGFVIPSENARYIKICITTDSVDGVVDAYVNNGEGVVINGKEYDIAVENTLNSDTEVFDIGVKGTFVKDYDGKIAAWIRNTALEDKYLYGYLIKAISKGSFDDKAEAKLLTEDGYIKIFPFAKKTIINNEKIKGGEQIISMLQASAKLLDPTFSISQLIKYKLNDQDEIKHVETVLQPVGLPDFANKQHLRREMERTALYSRSDNGYMLYTNGNTKEYPSASIVFCNNPDKIIFSVPPTETFEDDDYKVLTRWTPDYSKKIVDVFDSNDFKAPRVIVAYEARGETPLYRSYVMVDQITKALSIGGNEISVLRGFDGYGNVAYYSDDMNMFKNLKRGDLVNLYGTGEKVDRYDMVMSIDDVKNTDMSTLPTSFGTGLFEVYAVSDKHLVLQRGALGTNGKREFQRASFWRDNDVIGFQYGDIYYEETNGKPTVSTTVGGVYGVTDVGTDYASRVYIIESPGLALLVVYNIE
jgi:hypothetical protein